MASVIWSDTAANWIIAGTGLLTLAAAVFAAVFAGRAAKWTRKQADNSDREVKNSLRAANAAVEQATLTRKQFEATSAQLRQQRKERARDERRQIEVQLDALAPTVIARADRPMVWTSHAAQSEMEVGLAGDEEIVATEVGRRFRFEARVTFQNVGGTVARVDITDHNGKLSYDAGGPRLPQGTPLYLAPDEIETLTWERVVRAEDLRVEGAVENPASWVMATAFWVRDTGMNVRDEFRFNGDLRIFTRDGSRVMVLPQLMPPWRENVAEPVSPRIYERLDSGLPGISPAGGFSTRTAPHAGHDDGPNPPDAESPRVR